MPKISMAKKKLLAQWKSADEVELDYDSLWWVINTQTSPPTLCETVVKSASLRKNFPGQGTVRFHATEGSEKFLFHLHEIKQLVFGDYDKARFGRVLMAVQQMGLIVADLQGELLDLRKKGFE